MKDTSIFKRSKRQPVNYELEENKIIIEDLLKSLRHKTLKDFVNNIEILIKDLNISQTSGAQQTSKQSITDTYYAVHFETVNFRLNTETENVTVYIGFGLNLEMERTVLGFWLKRNSENSYKFWLKVCQELKDAGINNIEIREYNNQYWLSEAMTQVFGPAN